MTFDELLQQLADDYLNPLTLQDGRKDADRNGHTRLADLQSRYNLSSLKIQKLLVTAGVYEPVKTSSAYYAVKKMADAGNSMEEIMKQTGLSKAAVNAFLPYERGAKDLDKLGVGISGDAVRKRRQRSNEEMKKENARGVLTETMTDDALWNALNEHSQETFITSSGQRFTIAVMHSSDAEAGIDMAKNEPGQGEAKLAISISSHEQNIYIPKADVLAAYHKALEMMAETTGAADSLGEYDEYLRPVFIYLGVIEGDRSAVTTKRKVEDDGRCACCGRKTDSLFSVSTFDDLITLDKQFDEAHQASWTDDEKERDRIISITWAKEREYWKKKRAEQIEAARQSKAVESFEEEGERKLCKLCCQTIYDALLNGVIPPAKRTGGYEDMDDDELISFIFEECAEARCDYYEADGRVIKAQELDEQYLFLYEAMDAHSIRHSFALSTSRIPYPEGDIGFSFDAREIHRLTKAGKVAAANTDTDYRIRHFRMCRDGKDERHTALVGLAELMQKITETIRMESLSESHSPATNEITINNRHYGINTLGTIIPIYVEHAEEYRSMKGRTWDGGQYGFLIDGKLFTGDELALMFSSMEEWQIKFYADDPNSRPLRRDEFLMQVMLSQSDLVEETISLINMFAADGHFEREKDQENFSKMFEKYLLEKFRLYHESRPHGYGRLAGMEIIKKLKLIDGTEKCQEMVKAVLGR